MFEKLKQMIEQAVKNRTPFNPAVFDDLIAQTTEWNPLKRGGSNFRTHKIGKPESHRIEFKVSGGMIVFCMIFIILGLAVIAGITIAVLLDNEFDIRSILPALAGLPFALIGGGILYFNSKPIVFDRHSGFYWKGRKDPLHIQDRSKLKNYSELGKIYAVQIISEYIRSDKSSYYSYELNLVLKDGSRLNVIDHGNLKKLREDAEELALFLRAPVWDATSAK